MHSVTGQSTPVAQINSDIIAVNRAILQHSRWLAEWNKKLICGQPLSEDFLQSDAHKHCGFGRWYYSDHSQYTEAQDEFLQLEPLHRKLHDSVNVIVRKSNENTAIKCDDYDLFIACEMAFTFALVNLRDALFGQLYSFDYLTGVYNRQAFYSILDKEFARIERTSGQSSIVMVDLDFFKKVNDQYGHQAGDKVLNFFANYLKENLRPYDSVGRYGGEEFLLCLPNSTIKDAATIMERLREDLASHPITIKGPNHTNIEINITASFGISSMSKDHPPSQAIDTADSAMYDAKTAGRNQVRIYHYN